MLYPAASDETIRPEPIERPHREPMAVWKFILMLVAFPVFFNVAVGLGGWASAVLWLGFIVGLCLGAVRWGAESRDGRDWKAALPRLPDRHATAADRAESRTYL